MSVCRVFSCVVGRGCLLWQVILVVLRCRFKRSKSITHTTSMIFLLYQTQHHQIWIEIDSTVTIYPQDENGWWRKDKSLPLSNSQNNCLSWWTISVTINKTLLFIPALIPDPKIRIRSHHRQKAEVATAQHHPPVVQTNERMPCTGEDLHTWGVAHQYHPVLAQLHKINLHMTIYLDSCTRPIQGLGCFFFFHPHSLSDVTSLNRPQISQRNFENSKLSVMSKAKTMQTREIHLTINPYQHAQHPSWRFKRAY